MYLSILYGVIAGGTRLMLLLLLSLSVFSSFACIRKSTLLSVCTVCFTCVACLLFRLNNKSSQKLVQDRKSPVEREKNTGKAKYLCLPQPVFVDSMMRHTAPLRLETSLVALCLMINQSRGR